MRAFMRWVVIISVLACTTAQAAIVESACLTVTAVVNEEYGNAIVVALLCSFSDFWTKC